MLQLVDTADGSKTIFNPAIGENYHSRHGALQESLHVFLHSGLKHFLLEQDKREASILEVGFGTGLNFLLTANFCLENNVSLNYTGIEAFPLDLSLILQTGYEQYITPDLWQLFVDKYPLSINHTVNLTNNCMFHLAYTTLLQFKSEQQFDLIYFDAFSAIHQPDMWSHESIAHVSQFLKIGGTFVTYAITGDLKRMFKSLGFAIEKIPGAPGKREMLRAKKLH